MKKIIAFVLSLVMLMSACAFAEGTEILLKNVQVSSGEYVLFDLSGVELALSYGEEGEAAGAKLALKAADEEVLAVVGSLIGNALAVSMTGLSSNYSVDLETLAALASELVAELPVVVDPETESIEIPEESMAAFEEIGTKAAEILASAVTEGEAQEVDGVECAVTEVSVTEEQVAELVAMVVELLEGNPELMAAAGIESAEDLAAIQEIGIGVEGSIMEGEGLFLVDFYLNLSDKAAGEVVSLNFYCDVVDGWDIQVILGADVEGEQVALSFEIDLLDAETSWLNVDLEGAVDVLTIDEAQMDVLANEAMNSAMAAVTKLAEVNETIAALLSSEAA